jgi:hypothetical protein
MKEYPSFPPAVLRGCFINLAIIVFVIVAMTLSVNYTYRAHPLCRGGIGGGYPVLFLCDAGVGGSPISSWGKITLIDIPNGGIRPGGFLLDFLFYLIIAWVISFVISQILHSRVPRRDISWAAFISTVYVIGLLCGSLVFFSSELYDKSYARTPTPNPIIIPSATPFGTMPSLITPIPTLGP